LRPAEKAVELTTAGSFMTSTLVLRKFVWNQRPCYARKGASLKKRMQLDADERKLLASVERGEWNMAPQVSYFAASNKLVRVQSTALAKPRRIASGEKRSD
jgi:hypothetical protein